MRIDVYLKLMGIFKTRSAAGKGLSAGYVTCGGRSLKASSTVSRGDTIEIVKPDGSLQRIQVLDVPSGNQVSRKDRDRFFRTLEISKQW